MCFCEAHVCALVQGLLSLINLMCGPSSGTSCHLVHLLDDTASLDRLLR